MLKKKKEVKSFYNVHYLINSDVSHFYALFFNTRQSILRVATFYYRV